MRPVKVRNVVIGEGRPKICVPIVGVSRLDILREAKEIARLAADIVEWRADWFVGVFDIDVVIMTLNNLRDILGDTPILFTFRTLKEGGEKAISPDKYVLLNKMVVQTGLVDFIDVELFSGDDVVKELVEEAHLYDVKVVASNHDFAKTPSKEEIVGRLVKMQELGADIPKIAVMPQCKKDVLTLLEATEEMASEHADRPIITISMGKEGMISRTAGECFGSAVTFGAAGKASAPGQIGVEELKQVLDIFHDSL